MYKVLGIGSLFVYRIFPCVSNAKQPLIQDWPNAASSDPAQITEWWKKWPRANVGLLTGIANSLVVLDVDPRNGGDEELERLEKLHGRLPETMIVKTPQGGRHYYFSSKKPFPKGQLGPGLDLQGERAYVLAPPSIVDDKPYENFVVLPMEKWPEPPEWFNKAALTKDFEGKGGFTKILGPGVAEGSRNRALFEYVCWLIGRGTDENEVLRLAVQRNSTYIPGLGADEVELIVRSALGRYREPGTSVDGLKDPTIDLRTAVIPEVDWLWENRIERGTIAVFAGQFASGKSTMAAYLAEFVSGRGENCLFLQYENFSGLLRRVAAASTGTGRLSAWPQSDLIYLDNDGRQRLIRHCLQYKVSLVIVDVLVSAIRGVEWTNEQQMRTVIDPLEQFAGQTKTTFLFLIHVNKKEDLAVESRISGSNAVPTAARNIHLFLRNPDDPQERLMCEVKNSSGYEAAPTLRFAIEQTNGYGKAVIKGTSMYTAQEALSALRSKYVP